MSVPARIPSQSIQFQTTPEMLEWDDVSDIPAFTANQATLANMGGQLYLSFYEVMPPIFSRWRNSEHLRNVIMSIESEVAAVRRSQMDAKEELKRIDALLIEEQAKSADSTKIETRPRRIVNLPD